MTSQFFLVLAAVFIVATTFLVGNVTSFNLLMKVSRGRSKTYGVFDGAITALNHERLHGAGQKGSKNFIDPNKLFIGNLAYDISEEDLFTWLTTEGGVPAQNIVSAKVMIDWKTNKSKGYGFIKFTEPIYASSALNVMDRKLIGGRMLRLYQGVRKKVQRVKAKGDERKMGFTVPNE
jgi:hypothetical protein